MSQKGITSKKINKSILLTTYLNPSIRVDNQMKLNYRKASLWATKIIDNSIISGLGGRLLEGALVLGGT